MNKDALVLVAVHFSPYSRNVLMLENKSTTKAVEGLITPHTHTQLRGIQATGRDVTLICVPHDLHAPIIIVLLPGWTIKV